MPASITAAPNLPHNWRRLVQKGIDVYFEDVGGAVFDAVLPLLKLWP